MPVHSLRQGPLKKVSLSSKKLLMECLIQICAFCGDIFWLWCMIWVASVHSCNSPRYQNILNRFWMAQISVGLCLLHNTTFNAICHVWTGGNSRYSPKVNGKSIRAVLPRRDQSLVQRNHFKEVILEGKNEIKLGSVIKMSFRQVWDPFEPWNSPWSIPAAPFCCPHFPSPKIPCP